MLTQILLPDGNNLAVEQVVFDDTKIMIEIISTQPAAICPDCQQQSVRVHSRYQRTIADLAWADKQVELHWQARRFFCDASRCPRKTFMERRPAVVIPYARRTNRLAETQRKMGWLVGGTVGSCLLDLLKIPTSRQTVLRLIRSASAAKSPCLRIVGVDEWSFRKGHRYGTILVDLERQQVIELLSERTAESLAQYATWLLLANKPDLSSDKQTALDRILQTSSEVARAYNFAQAFLRIIRQQLSRALDPWLDAVLTHRVPGLVHFARGLTKDLAAIRAALTLPYSNGQVEGQINRLKLIKRQMYGRANFDLLRLRVLSPSFHELWP